MQQSVREYMQKIGRKGGKRRAEVLSKNQRKKVARKGGIARARKLARQAEQDLYQPGEDYF